MGNASGFEFQNICNSEILQKFNEDRKNKNSQNENLFIFNLKKGENKSVDQHYHNDIAQISAHKKPIFEYRRNQYFNNENGDGKDRIYKIEPEIHSEKSPLFVVAGMV